MPQFNTVATSAADKATFMSKVWAYFGLAILVAALGAWSGEIVMQTLAGVGIPYYAVHIAFMGLMFAQWKFSHVPAMLYVFAFVSGLVLYPTLAFADATGQMMAVIQALLSAGGLFFAAAIFGYTTKKDLSGMGQFLMMTMFGLFIASIINIFIGGDTMRMILSGVGVVLFSAYTSYDVQAIKNGAYDSAVSAAYHLYFNLFAIFQYLLSFFLSAGE